MEFGVVWTQKSLHDIDRLEEFLWQKSPQSAARAIMLIVEATRQLKQFPEAGRPAPDPDLDHRELIVPFASSGYIVHYQVLDGVIEILDVRHMREAGY